MKSTKKYIALARKIYSNYLSKMALFRALKQILLNLYFSHRRKFSDVKAYFMPMSEFSKKQEITKIQLIAPTTQKTKNLIFFKPDTSSLGKTLMNICRLTARHTR